VFPTNGIAPLASLVNYVAGQTIANAADVKLGADGQISAQPLTTTNLVVDVYGYFTDVEELAGNNTALGLNALLGNTTGSFNTASGFRPLQSNTTGLQNTATGAAALLSNTTGFNNRRGGRHPQQQHHGRRQHRHGGQRPLQQHHGRRQHRHGVRRPLEHL
jgi:hypothetical protein